MHFVRPRKYWYLISLLIIIPGIISLASQGLNLGIDFTGGSLIEVEFERAVTVEEVRTVLADMDLGQSVVQLSGEDEVMDQVLIRTRVIKEEKNHELVSNLGEKLGELTVLRNDAVGPVIGEELTRSAILALSIVSLAIVVYISWRFEFKQGIAAIVALLHDALITLSLFSLFRLQVDSAFVAAILTIIGYSINATIVIFDRLRENLQSAKKKESLESVINRSLWETIARSVNTGLTTLFILVALYFLGGATLKTFVLALIIGIASGTYSSIFISSQFWLDIKERFSGAKKSAGANA